METETKFCKKCNSYLEKNNFHKSKSKSYPDGHITTCKTCIKNKIVVVKDKNIFTITKGEFIVEFN